MKHIEILNICRSDDQTHDTFTHESLKFLSENGFKVELAPHFKDPKSRARLFVDTVARNDLDYSWIVRGGIETVYTLPFIDFSNLKINNTILGSSDFTHLALPITKLGSSVWYGPTARHLSSDMNSKEREIIFKQLEDGIDNNFLNIYNFTEKRVSTNNLVGGTLQILLNLIGTDYCPDLNGKNIYIEHHYIPGESVLEVKYWLNSLRLKTSIENVGSLLIGELIYADGETLADQKHQIDLIHEVF